jgi:hypothetical protein
MSRDPEANGAAKGANDFNLRAMKKIRRSTMRARKTTPIRAPADPERMTPEEQEAILAAIEREITIKGSQISPATLRFSVGNLGLEFAGWFMKNLPMRDDLPSGEMRPID